MIITRLRGGLGNQLFQYACGRALSLRTDNPQKLDIEGYERAANGDTPRSYLLSHFNIIEDIATLDEIRRLKYPFGIASKAWRYASTKFLRRFNTGYIPRYMHAKGDIYLDGFWQTELYFADTETTIRKELTLKDPLGATAQTFADQIVAAKKNGVTTVSLHVRRGDVARDAFKNPYYGITTPAYYKKALAALVEKLAARAGNGENAARQNIRIFVFSDGIEWTKENIDIPFPTTYVDGGDASNKIADYEDLALMSMCDHNIVANSSFSWWGAWLNPNPEKIVIAPKDWIRTNKHRHKDTVPSSWIRV